MRRFVFILGLILITISLTQASIKSIEIALEAELAQKVEAPMKSTTMQSAKGLPTESSSGWKANPLLVVVAKVGPSLGLTLPRKENTPFGGVS